MALKYTGTGIFKYGLDVQGQFPLDSRVVVQNASDLTNYATLFVSGGVPTWYVGMTVFAEDTKKLYILASAEEGFVPVGADESQLAKLFNYVGSVEKFADLPTSGLKVGDVYNVKSDFTIEIPVEGLEDNIKETYFAGTNVVWTGTAWDPLAGSIDLSGYATKIELQTLGTTVAGHTTTIGNLNSQLAATNDLVAKKVDAVDGSSLITSEKLALIDTNAGDITTLKQNVVDLGTEDNKLSVRIQTLENLVGLNPDGTPGENASLETRVSKNETDISALQTSNTALTNLTTQQTENISKLSTDLNTLTTRVTTNEGSVATLNTTVAGHTTQISELNDALEDFAANDQIRDISKNDKFLITDGYGNIQASVSLGIDDDTSDIQLFGKGSEAVQSLPVAPLLKALKLEYYKKDVTTTEGDSVITTSTPYIKLVNTKNSNEIISEFDATDFVKDGMINSVSYNSDTKKLNIKWNTDAGIADTAVDLTSLVDTYTAGSGLIVDNNKFSVNLDVNGGLVATDNGISVKVAEGTGYLNNRLTVSQAGLVVNIDQDLTDLAEDMEATMDTKINNAFAWVEVKPKTND